MADDTGISLRFGRREYDRVTDGIDELLREFREGVQGSSKVAGKALLEYLNQVAQAVVGRHPINDDELLQSIVKSVQVVGSKSWDTLEGRIGGSRRISIFEFGGTIRSKGKLLTIPLPAALKSGKKPPFARQWTNSFVTESKAGNLIIFQRGTGRWDITPLYVLVESITIRPRLGIRDELQAQLPYFQERLIDLATADVLKALQ